MNGLIRGGLIEGVHDLWGDAASANRILEQHHDHYAARQYDRLYAHINTPDGRVFVHRGDTDAWLPPRLPSRQLLDWMDALTLALRVKSLQYSPQARGLSLLDFTRKDNPEHFQYNPLPESPTAEPTMNFTRKLDDWKEVGNTLHVFDMRAAWLSSARTAPTGYGGYIKTQWNWEHQKERREGLWMVKLNRPQIPHAPIMHDGLYPTAIVRAAHAHGQPISVLFGWVWEGQSTMLRKWCERIVLARGDATMAHNSREKSAWLQDAIKRIYTRTFGTLEQQGRKSQPWAYQPHWYLSLRAESARRIWQVYDSSPYFIGCDVDTLYAVAPPSVPWQEILPQATPDAYQSGHWRYEGSTPLTRAMYNLLGQKATALSGEIRSRNALEKPGV